MSLSLSLLLDQFAMQQNIYTCHLINNIPPERNSVTASQLYNSDYKQQLCKTKKQSNTSIIVVFFLVNMPQDWTQKAPFHIFQSQSFCAPQRGLKPQFGRHWNFYCRLIHLTGSKRNWGNYHVRMILLMHEPTDKFSLNLEVILFYWRSHHQCQFFLLNPVITAAPLIS